ncbi:MAG: hypothetical protein QE263_04500 [Vampirovibrionales bacterium]|nr:hypothetical protein [Vampirovibrionales bacterium]
MRLSTEALLNELQRFQVLREDLVAWENALGLSIPSDADGKPVYSQHHVNLFKNIKKHLALGKSFSDIQQLVQIPANLSVAVALDPKPETPQPSPNPLPRSSNVIESSTSLMTSQPKRSPSSMLTSPPRRPAAPVTQPDMLPTAKSLASISVDAHQYDLMDLLRQTMAEKDQLQQQLIDVEKLNSHLNNANGMFHRKVKQLDEELKASQAAGDQNRLFQLMEDKARLHHQVLDSEKTIGQLKKQIMLSDELVLKARQEAMISEQQLAKQIQFLQSELSSGDGSRQPNADTFCGQWNEEAYWLETRFDTYGVDIPADRRRVLTIAQPPMQLIGPMAVLSQTYRLEQQPQWQRTETLLLIATNPMRLQGLMDVTYRLNETPVAQAWYRIGATKQP